MEYLLTVPGGYGALEVSPVEDTRQHVTMERGYARVTNLTLITDEELQPEMNQLTDGRV